MKASRVVHSGSGSDHHGVTGTDAGGQDVVGGHWLHGVTAGWRLLCEHLLQAAVGLS